MPPSSRASRTVPLVTPTFPSGCAPVKSPQPHCAAGREALALHRVSFGLALVVAFSAGLAGVLVAIGLLFVYAGHWLERLPVTRLPDHGWLVRTVPMVSAAVITLAGLAITAQGVSQIGLFRL